MIAMCNPYHYSFIVIDTSKTETIINLWGSGHWLCAHGYIIIGSKEIVVLVKILQGITGDNKPLHTQCKTPHVTPYHL